MPQGQGACLPPLVSGPLEEPWPSEGILVKRLAMEHGADFAVRAMEAHRETFISEIDFHEIASLGIRTIRIPIVWSMFADKLSFLDPEVYGGHDPETAAVLVPDPYYHEEIKMVTICRAWFRGMLEKAAAAGLKVVLDMHAMPGGSSDGTYSGIWPLRPQFWQGKARIGKGDVSLTDIGLTIAKAFIDWTASLDDLISRGHIWGVEVLNEPAHLSAGKGWANGTQVLEWITHAAEYYRSSSLPGRGVRLYLQLIETAFKDFDGVVGPWYHNTFSQKERHTWAVMSRHFYTAWGATGQIIQGGAYQCDEKLAVIRQRVQPAIKGFADDFVTKFDGLRAMTEWSLGSYWDAMLACSETDVLRLLFELNVVNFASLERNTSKAIEPIFWTWSMPYGPKFEPGWSLKFFSGYSNKTDSNGRCVVGNWAKLDPLAR